MNLYFDSPAPVFSPTSSKLACEKILSGGESNLPYYNRKKLVHPIILPYVKQIYLIKNQPQIVGYNCFT